MATIYARACLSGQLGRISRSIREAAERADQLQLLNIESELLDLSVQLEGLRKYLVHRPLHASQASAYEYVRDRAAQLPF